MQCQYPKDGMAIRIAELNPTIYSYVDKKSLPVKTAYSIFQSYTLT